MKTVHQIGGGSLPTLPTPFARSSQGAELAGEEGSAEWIAFCDTSHPEARLGLLAGARQPYGTVNWAVRQARRVPPGPLGAEASAARCPLVSSLCALRPRLDGAAAEALSMFLSTWPLDIALDLATRAAAQPHADPTQLEPIATLARACTSQALPESLFHGGPAQGASWSPGMRGEVADALLRLAEGPVVTEGAHPFGATLERLWAALLPPPSAQMDAAAPVWLDALRLAAELPPEQRARLLELLAQLIRGCSAPPAELFAFLRRAPADSREELARRLEWVSSRRDNTARVLLDSGEVAPLAWAQMWERLRRPHRPPFEDRGSVARMAAVLRPRTRAARDGIVDAYLALIEHPALANRSPSVAQAAEAIAALANHPHLAAAEGWRAAWLPRDLPGGFVAAARRVAAAGHKQALVAAPQRAGQVPGAWSPRSWICCSASAARVGFLMRTFAPRWRVFPPRSAPRRPSSCSPRRSCRRSPCLGASKLKMAHERRHPRCSPACWVPPGARSGEHCRLARCGEAPNGRLIQAGTNIERPSGPAVRLPPGPDGP